MVGAMPWDFGETAELTLMKNGSGWLCSSSSLHTVTGPPLVMLPPTKTCKRPKVWVAETARMGLIPAVPRRRRKSIRMRPGARCCLTCPTSLGLRVSEMSYWRMSPCSQLLKYRNLSSSEMRMSVMKPWGGYDRAAQTGGSTGSARGSRGAPRHPARGCTDLACLGGATPPPSCWGLGSPSRPPSLLAAGGAGQSMAPRGSACVAEAG